MNVSASMSPQPTYVPAMGASVAPEPEDESAGSKIAESMALSMLMSSMGVPGPIAELVDHAHHGLDAAEAMGGGTPAQSNGEGISISPAGFRPQDTFRPRRG